MSDSDSRTPPARLVSVDAYRGFVMFLMMAEALHLKALADAYPESGVWPLLAKHQEHVEWAGCTLHDLIQPSFSFLVGVALPFSIASRSAKGQSTGWMTAHAFWRAFVLVALGIFLRSVGKSQTNYTFDDTLTQIGLGYGFLFLLGFRPARDHWIAFAAIVVGYWAAFAMYSPGAGFESSKLGVPDDWPHHVRGFASHWDKNANLAWAFDARFMNLFPRPAPFRFHPGGYATLSFIPTLATMILGLIAGNVLRGERPGWSKVTWFVVAGAVGLSAGYAIGEFGICPVVKRIWTPSWVLFSGGWCFLLLAAWYAAVDLKGLGAPAFPLAVIGRNSIAAYCLTGLIKGFITQTFATHLGPHAFRFEALGPAYESPLRGAAVLAALWLILFWMDRRKIYLRV